MYNNGTRNLSRRVSARFHQEKSFWNRIITALKRFEKATRESDEKPYSFAPPMDVWLQQECRGAENVMALVWSQQAIRHEKSRQRNRHGFETSSTLITMNDGVWTRLQTFFEFFSNSLCSSAMLFTLLLNICLEGWRFPGFWTAFNAKKHEMPLFGYAL